MADQSTYSEQEKKVWDLLYFCTFYPRYLAFYVKRLQRVNRIIALLSSTLSIISILGWYKDLICEDLAASVLVAIQAFGLVKSQFLRSDADIENLVGTIKELNRLIPELSELFRKTRKSKISEEKIDREFNKLEKRYLNIADELINSRERIVKRLAKKAEKIATKELLDRFQNS